MSPRTPSFHPSRSRLLVGSGTLAIALAAAPASAGQTADAEPASGYIAAKRLPSAATAQDTALLVTAPNASTFADFRSSGLDMRTVPLLGWHPGDEQSLAVRVGPAATGLAARPGEIVNDAQIEGDIVLGDDDDAFYQTLAGSVSGAANMGGGDDTFWLEQRGDSLAALPAGGLDGGDGFDRFGIRMTQSGTVNPADLPTGFERFALDLCGCEIVATIGEGTIVGGLDVTGSGAVTNLATITYEGAGAALTVRGGLDETGRGLDFINKGLIEAIGTDAPVLIDAGYDGYNYGTFVNEGTIALSGTYGIGLAVAAYDPASGDGFVNRGEIIGSGDDALTLYLQGSGRNEGVIRALGSDSGGATLGYYSALTNTAAGTITGTQTGVTMLAGSRLVNAGVIAGGTGVSAGSSMYLGATTIVNDIGAAIRGTDGTAIAGTGDGALALANHGALVGNVGLASGRDVVWLDEGSTLEGSLTLGGGDDTLVVAIDRLSSGGVLDVSGLVTGSIDSGAGSDTLWLRAATSGTRNVYAGEVSGFEGGLVYEAAGESTELVLRGPLREDAQEGAYEGTLRIAGDGRVVIDMDFDNGSSASPSLVVAADSSASIFGSGGAGLDLVLASTINGGSGGAVDAAHARRVELRENAEQIVFAGGIGLATGSAEVLLAGGTEIHKTGSAGGTLLSADYAHIVNRGTLREDDRTATADDASTGVRMTGGLLSNERGPEGTGRIAVLGTGIEIGTGGEIRNDGEIVSGFGNAIEATGYGTTRIVNGTQGIIRGHVQGHAKGMEDAAIVGGYGSERVENAGTIDGHVSLGGGEDFYLAAGGTLTGDLLLGAGDDTLLTRDGASLNVSGSIAAGDGIDAFGKSFTQSASFDLGTNVLPDGFEMHGVEAASADTVVTVTSAQQQAHGLRASGSGTVRNEAEFSIPEDGSGGYAGIEVRDPDGASALNLVNAGTITSAFDGVVAQEGLLSFTNTGEIEADGDGLTIHASYQSQALVVANSGTITSHEGAAARIYSETSSENGDALAFTNSGTLAQTGEIGDGLRLRNYGGKASVGNTGAITASGDFGYGARLYSEGILDVTNGGTIAATGRAATALLIEDAGYAIGSPDDCPDGEVPPQVTARLTNSGTVRASGAGIDDEGYHELSTGLFALAERDNGIVRVDNLAGGTVVAAGASSVAVLVVGAGGDGYGRTAVDDALRSFDAAELAGYGGGDVDAELRFFELDNAGTIRGGADIALGDEDSAYAAGTSLTGLEPTGESRVIAGAIQTIDTTDHIVNRIGGTIIGNVSLGAGADVFESYGTLAGNLDLGSGDDALVYGITSQFSGIAEGGVGSDTLVVDLNGAGAVDFDQFRGFENLSQRGAGSVTIRGTTDMATLSIGGSSVTVAADTTFAAGGTVALTGSDAAEHVSVAGTVAGSIELGAGADIVTLQQGGEVTGAVDLGAGDDRLELLGGTAGGVVDGGSGIDTVAFQIAGAVSQLPDVINFEALDVSGEGLLSIAPAQDYATITLRDGADLTVTPGALATSIGAIVGDDSANVVTMRVPITGSVSLGGGDDRLDIELQGTLSGALDGGAGTDTLDLHLLGAATIAGNINAFEIINVDGTSPLTLAGTLAAGQTMTFDGGDNSLIVAGGSVLGTVDGGAGNDTIAFDTQANAATSFDGGKVRNFENLVGTGAGTLVVAGDASFQTVAIEGNLTVGEGHTLTSGSTMMGGGDNVLTLAGNAAIVGAVDGGAGNDRLVLFQNAEQVRRFSSVDASGFEELESGGPGELVIDRDASFAVVDLLGARMTVAAGNTFTVPVLVGGNGANHLAVAGTVAGSVDLGGGDDRLTLGNLGAVTGTRSGGAGTDTLELRTGSAAQPVRWDGTGFDSFERLEVSAGNLRLDGSASYDRVTIAGGSFVGEAGSQIASAEAIVVANGATFGSAGTVAGDIEVRGTLAPGASPGTMTVEGNVAFLSGSNFALEVEAAAHDVLDVSGKLAIASGTTMDITGALGSSPLSGAIDLVVADGGITGGFTTINKSNSVFGYVVTRGNRIQIVGEFQNDAGLPTNVQAAVDYSNQLLQSGRMVQAYTGILSQLTDASGAVRSEGFARLTPESYASAVAASLDTGLAVSDAVRTVQLAAPTAPGWYGFGQGFSQWSRHGADGMTGASSARSDTQGLIGGIGYATAQGSRWGAFIGSLDTKQKVRGIEAETQSDGMVLGGFADVALGKFAVHAALAYDMSRAKTSRSVHPDESITGKYDLGGFVGDATLSYAIDAGSWSIRPQVGVTFVEGHRDAVREQGSPFALEVAEGSANAWFGDASVTVARIVGTVRPYLEAGLRQHLNGGRETASGGFVDIAQAGMIVEAADTDGTKVRLGAGIAADVAENVKLNLGYRAEFGNQARHNVTGGVTFSF